MAVSICMPVYNGSKTLRRAIESVLSQTYRDFELLVWDDGSADNTFDIASEYGVRVFRAANQGVAKARNEMLRESRFELIALIDHDDLWNPQKLEFQVPIFQDPTVVLAHTNCRFMQPSGETEIRDLTQLSDQRPFTHILPDNRVITSSVLFRKANLASEGFTSLARCSDWLAWFDLAATGRFHYEPETLVDYAVRPDSLANAGFLFHQAQFEVLTRFVIPQRKRLFKNESLADRRLYQHLARRSSGVALSSMSSCKWKVHDASAARVLAFRALIRAPRVFRVWTRAWRAFTNPADRPR